MDSPQFDKPLGNATENTHLEKICQKPHVGNSFTRLQKNVRFRGSKCDYVADAYENCSQDNDYTYELYNYVEDESSAQRGEYHRRRSVCAEPMPRNAPNERRRLVVQASDAGKRRMNDERFPVRHRITDKNEMQDYDDQSLPHRCIDVHESPKLRTRSSDFCYKFQPKINAEKSPMFLRNSTRGRDRRTTISEEYDDILEPTYRESRRRLPEERCRHTKHFRPKQTDFQEFEENCSPHFIKAFDMALCGSRHLPTHDTSRDLQCKDGHNDWCDKHIQEKKHAQVEATPYVHILRRGKPYKQVLHLVKDPVNPDPQENGLSQNFRKMSTSRDPRNSRRRVQEIRDLKQVFHSRPYVDQALYCSSEGHCDHPSTGKAQKKVLESYNKEMPIVSEQHENFRDSMLKVQLPGFTSPGGEIFNDFPPENIRTNGNAPSLVRGEEISFSPAISKKQVQQKIHKVRSRRTRISGRPRTGWRKAFIHTGSSCHIISSPMIKKNFILCLKRYAHFFFFSQRRHKERKSGTHCHGTERTRILLKDRQKKWSIYTISKNQVLPGRTGKVYINLFCDSYFYLL